MWSRWSPAVPQALAALPETAECPHDLYLELLRLALDRGGRVALVERPDAPAAVVGLRPAGRRRWAVLTNWLLPGVVCPGVRPEEVLPTLARLGQEVTVAWWRLPTPPGHPAVRERVTTPVHRLRVAEREAFWRGNKQWRTVRHARNRCAGLEVEVDRPGDAGWVAREWARKWSAGGAEGPDSAAYAVAERVTIAEHLEPLGRHVTVVLRDGDRPLAGATNLVHGDTLVAGVLYRDESVGSLPTGVRVVDAVFETAERLGLAYVDVGGGHDYKAKWAPVDGERSALVVAPAWEYAARRAVGRVRALARSGGRQG